MTITTAVIIAAGMGTRLGEHGHLHPKGFIEIGDQPIVEESILNLVSVGMERIVIVTGHLAHFYEDLASRNSGLIETVHNTEYAETGSMHSLAQVRNVLSEPFLLLESDLIYERRALTELLERPEADIVLMSGRTHSGDEVWIETHNSYLRAMSKDRHAVGDIAGELVGICKISPDLFEAMCDDAEAAFPVSPKYCYETDCLVSVAARRLVHCYRIDDLIWSEIDDATHLRRAYDQIYPRIREVDDPV